MKKLSLSLKTKHSKKELQQLEKKLQYKLRTKRYQNGRDIKLIKKFLIESRRYNLNFKRKCENCGNNISPNNQTRYTFYWSSEGANILGTNHTTCTKEIEKNDIYEMQKIDCACNDCFHFDRNPSMCKKKNIKVKALPKYCNPDNFDCFEHRKDKIL